MKKNALLRYIFVALNFIVSPKKFLRNFHFLLCFFFSVRRFCAKNFRNNCIFYDVSNRSGGAEITYFIDKRTLQHQRFIFLFIFVPSFLCPPLIILSKTSKFIKSYQRLLVIIRDYQTINNTVKFSHKYIIHNNSNRFVNFL